MPELPDVEVFKRYLDSKALKQTIENVEVLSPDMLKGSSAQAFQSLLKGKQFDSSRRHGKYLFVHVAGDNWVLVHFGMTGFLKYFGKDESPPEHARVIFDFDNGYRLAYDNQRKLGRVALVGDVGDFIQKQQLGPDVLDTRFDYQAFKKAIAASKSTIKSTLMDQQRMAGIGNEYSDEILFQARVYPEIRVSQLDEQDLKQIFKSAKRVLETAIENEVDLSRFPDTYLLPVREEGARCPVCGGAVKSIKVSGRTGYFCPKCQTKK